MQDNGSEADRNMHRTPNRLSRVQRKARVTVKLDWLRCRSAIASLSIAVALGLAIASGISPTQAQEPDQESPPFPELPLCVLTDDDPPRLDLDRSNVAACVITPRLARYIAEAEVSPTANDVSILFHYATLLGVAGFDAIAPYHPTAVGVYSRLGRRPAAESVTERNVNIAVLFAVYRVTMAFAPENADGPLGWRSMLTVVGLDPDDRSEDLSTPQGIGNLAGRMVVAGRRYDGMNWLGEATNGMRFADTTNWQPTNSGYNRFNPSHWQPLTLRQGPARYQIQRHVTPQWADTEPWSMIDPRAHRFPPPNDSYVKNLEAYRAQVDYVLEVSSHLSDEQKMKVEFFDNKIRDLLGIINPAKIGPTRVSFWANFLVMTAAYDAGVIAWQEKLRYDAVRPVTAIGYLYPNAMVTSWTPERGFVEVLGPFWQSYIETPDHTEYPSGTTCTCVAYARAMQLFTGSDEIPGFRTPQGGTVPGTEGISGVFQAGSSRREPGRTPSADLEIHYSTWSEWARDCGESRIWGGAHFRPSVDQAFPICTAAGESAFEYYQSLMAGTARPRGPAEPLDPDPLRDSTDWAPAE